MGTRIGLNLGSGDKLYESTDEMKWINVDLDNNAFKVQPDISSDLRKLPFDDEYADTVESIHVVEHFHVYEIDAVLREWKRVLKTGGQIILEMPCMNKIIHNFSKKMDFRYTYLGLFGDVVPNQPAMDHHWCYSKGQMEELLKQVGFTDIQYAEPLYHLPKRDMRFTARK